MKYEEALQQLDDIVRKMENNEISIDQLANELKKANKLTAMCRDKLTKTEEEIQKILDNGK